MIEIRKYVRIRKHMDCFMYGIWIYSLLPEIGWNEYWGMMYEDVRKNCIEFLRRTND